ncbi:EAL domain-containing protein [Acidovorax sp. RAC01]|uniref:EAL domain-containing protein n=1 Tax=Acidovorax sp. RAC01 TaxID=1842533 RepID=UPI00083E8339|nr:EAL domain-containing protein [Acidovorax sp. RAC01]AOG22818.1 diguanylate cyclase domain protein [Acidovorax sp. RAC01]
MPITILFIESDAGHAKAVKEALADPWSGWTVDIAGSLTEGQAYLCDRRPDVVLAAERTLGGAAFDLLHTLRGIPAIIVVGVGHETRAAQALRHGFDDFAVQDARLDYLLELPAQIDAVLERHAGKRVREEAEAMLARQHKLLQAISQAQAIFIASAGPRAAFEALLGELMALTQSGFGMVGQVERADNGDPYLRVHALTDISWDDASRARYARHADEGMVFDNLNSLVGATLVSGQPVLANDAPNDSRSAGIPAGHPVIQTYVGLPIHATGELVAMVGLANRPGGYTEADIRFLQPLLSTIGQLEMARRAELARTSVEQQLARTSELLAEKTRALEGTLASVSQGISNVDAEGRIRVYNRRYLEVLDLPEELLATQPRVEEVVRFQKERGDFGPGFELIEPAARAYVASEYPHGGNDLPMPPRYVRKNPHGRYIEVRTHPLKEGGRVRTFTDVTDYLSTLEALRQSEARWRSLTQLSSDWYWEQDAQFRFVRVDGNVHKAPDAWGAYQGRTPWEMAGTVPGDREWAEYKAQLQAHQVFHDFEIQQRGEDGSLHWVSISGEPIYDLEGSFTGYRGIASDITDRKRAEAEIERLAFFDDLTGLPNRRLLSDRLEHALATCVRDQCHGALFFLDLDNFKGVNDTLGHDWGDQLLVQVGARLRGCVRTTDTVARLGGDEFVVVVTSLNTGAPAAAAEAEAIGHKLLQALNQPYRIQHADVHSTPSIGVALFCGRAMLVQELLKRADLAMYQAKSQGRNTLCFFDPAVQAAASERSALEGAIRQGLARREFILHFQRVVDERGAVLGAEALVRWAHPQRGLVPPGEFIPLAEQTGLIVSLGRLVLEMACRQLSDWAGAGDPSVAGWNVSVNVSAHEFRQADYVDQVKAVLLETGADPRHLKLELTESLLLHDVEDSILKMQALRKLGVGFSLDDFGTGYSSLSYLKRLPLDQLKIDQSFVRDVLTDPNDATIACTIIALARSLGLDVVAEGVESEGQRAFLLQNGCRKFQGYLFGRPGSADQLRQA